MSDVKHARALLEAALRDLKALEGMSDPAIFADEIAGFHAQQAAEKTLKAWLALRNVQYPRTHDLRVLLDLLEASGEAPGELRDLLEYADYAVAFRYESLAPDAEPLDRVLAVQRLRALYSRVRALFQTAEGA